MTKYMKEYLQIRRLCWIKKRAQPRMENNPEPNRLVDFSSSNKIKQQILNLLEGKDIKKKISQTVS